MSLAIDNAAKQFRVLLGLEPDGLMIAKGQMKRHGHVDLIICSMLMKVEELRKI